MNYNELKHYGVLGMKWGVRHDRSSSAFRKASKKANKYRRKADKNSALSSKYEAKAHKQATSKALKILYGRDTRDRLSGKRLRLSENRSKKASKYTKKYNKWTSKMSEAFSNVKVSDISERDLQIGSNYIDLLLQN